MAEYAKKTVAELTEILKSRGLSHTGKKAELIARLNENDEKVASESAEVPAPEIPEAEPEQAPPTQQENIPTADQPETIQPAPTADATEADAAPTEEATYTLNLKASDVDSELAKRKARAERFGTSTAVEGAEGASTANGDADAESLKNLERAKRFGGGNTAISKLDEALPSERLRGNKRKAGAAGVEDTSSSLDDPGLRAGFANRGRGRGGKFRGRGGPRGGGGSGNNPRGPQGVSKSSAFSSEKDRMAAEARKKKFATA